MTYDVFTYNGEKEILDLRFNILDRSVDKFVICEAKTTFSGNEKPLYWSRDENLFKKWWHKIDFYVIDEEYTPEEIDIASYSPNTQGAKHWKTEFLQKEQLKKAIAKQNPSDEDVCYIGDVDEIWDPSYMPQKSLEKLKLYVYAYYLNNRSTEEFWGTLVGQWGLIKNECLNHLRSSEFLRGEDYGGWHFTSMGGFKEVRRKLNDSYTPESYNTTEVQEQLKHRLSTGQDYLGRSFSFTQEDLDWPQYLRKNKWRYINLIK